MFSLIYYKNHTKEFLMNLRVKFMQLQKKVLEMLNII